MNELMEVFWTIVNHPDASQVKFEIAKGLSKFTQENIIQELEDKKKLLDEESKDCKDNKNLTKEE